MSGSAACKVELGDAFAATVLAFNKANYKKDTRGAEAAGQVLARLVDQFYAHNSPKIPRAHFEPFPPGTAALGLQLWKVNFNAPNLSGSAECGRLVYLHDQASSTIIPLCVYTHKQYPGVVPAKDMAKLIEEAKQWLAERAGARK